MSQQEFISSEGARPSGTVPGDRELCPIGCVDGCPYCEPTAAKCTRSHPHELMDAECERITVAVRAARLGADTAGSDQIKRKG